MTQTKAYTMEAFVDDARAVFESTKDPRTQAQQIARHMTTLLAEPGWLEEKLNLPAEGGFGRVDLHQDEEYGHPDGGFLLMCGIQRPGSGQPTPRPRHNLGGVRRLQRGNRTNQMALVLPRNRPDFPLK